MKYYSSMLRCKVFVMFLVIIFKTLSENVIRQRCKYIINTLLKNITVKCCVKHFHETLPKRQHCRLAGRARSEQLSNFTRLRLIKKSSIFMCNKFNSERDLLETEIKKTFTTENFQKCLLDSRENWSKICTYIKTVLTNKKEIIDKQIYADACQLADPGVANNNPC